MRSKLAKAVRKEFKLKLEESFPKFSEDKNSLYPLGSRIFFCELKESLFAFIGLLISPKDDSFTIEIGWSKNKLFHECTRNLPNEISHQDRSGCFRLSHLYNRKLDFWWYLSKRMTLDDDPFSFVESSIEESLNKVPDSINEAIEQIKTYAIPYFENLKSVF